MDVVSLGMLTVDDLIFSDPDSRHKEVRDLLGGAGTFAVLGARLVAGPSRADRIGWVVHEGNDFPPTVKAEIESWALRTKFVQTLERPTTRARNRYEGEERFFNFETPKMHVMPDMLDDDQLRSKVFHIISTPERCISLIETIHELRHSRLGIEGPPSHNERPLFVWEPMEQSCEPSQMAAFQTAMKLVDVFSPNELEFSRLLGLRLPADGGLPQKVLRHHSYELLDDCQLQAVVVRLGGNGVYVASTHPETRDIHMPAYFDSRMPGAAQHVVDVTGGGNAFLGAYCYGLAQPTGDWALGAPTELNLQESAAIAGSVAASFVIEQFGMPRLAIANGNSSESWGEMGESVALRMRVLSDRMQAR